MAKIIHDPKELPERVVAIPGSKNAETTFPYQDWGHPEEVDEFLALIREIRGHTPPKQPCW